jgi:hypothetical protein
MKKMEYKQNGGPSNPLTVESVDAHSILHRKQSQAAKACDAADVLDGLKTLQNLTLRVAAFAHEVSVASVSAARRLTPAQRDAVRKGWRPLILPRLASDVPVPPTPQERFAGLVSELGGIGGALKELVAIEQNGGNGHGA